MLLSSEPGFKVGSQAILVSPLQKFHKKYLQFIYGTINEDRSSSHVVNRRYLLHSGCRCEGKMSLLPWTICDSVTYITSFTTWIRHPSKPNPLKEVFFRSFSNFQKFRNLWAKTSYFFRNVWFFRSFFQKFTNDSKNLFIFLHIINFWKKKKFLN